MSPSVLSTAIIVVGAGFLVALERIRPYDPRQRLFRDGLWMDLVWYTVVQNWVLGFVIAAIIRFLEIRGGRAHLVTSWPVSAQLVLFLLTHDAYIYWFHRLQHRVRLLWRIHEAHHSTKDVDWLSGSRSHPLEILINQTIEFAPIVLLGGAPELWYLKATVDALWGMYIHSNVDVRSGRLQYVLNGPEMHRWHHAVEIVDINFATKFAFWDWIFRTAYLPKTKPAAYGIVGQEYPTGYLAQTAYAFRAPS